MANIDTPKGLIPVKHVDGRTYNGAGNWYYVPATDNTALFIGDPVTIAGSGDATGKLASVTRATAGTSNYILGPVVAVARYDAKLGGPQPLREDTVYREASTERVVFVADDPDLEFEIQEDSDGGALAITNIGQNADIIAGTGSTVTGYSGFELDSSTASTTATRQLRILGLVQRDDNAIGTNAKIRVKINLHTLNNTTGV